MPDGQGAAGTERGVRTLRLEAVGGAFSASRAVEIQGLEQAEALKLAETLIVPFLRTTAGDVKITWTQT